MSRAVKSKQVFKTRAEYTDWVARHCVDPFARWQQAFKRLPRLAPFWRARQVGGTFLLPSLGHAVAGTVALKAPRLGAPAIWIAASRAEARALRVLVRNPVTCVVPYALPEKLLREAEAWARQCDRARELARLGLDPNAFTFAFAGRISRRKGLAALVNEAERQRFACQLVIAGYREPGFVLPESRYVRVIELGRLSRVRALRLVALADAVPSLSTDGAEDFGFLAREALALGRPVLMTRWGGLNDISLSPARDALFVTRIGVQAASGEPALAGLKLAAFAKKCRALKAPARRAAAREIRAANARAMREGLSLAHDLALRGQGRPVQFLPLARELALSAAARGEVDPNASLPLPLQRKLMTGPFKR